MNTMLELFEENPVILGINKKADIEIAKNSESKLVMTLFGEISKITEIIDSLKQIGKTVLVNIDLVDGFSSRNSVIEFMKNNTKADGIVSSKASVLRYAKEVGFFTIHRFFILDSASYRNIKKQISISKADIINIVPGWTKIIQWTVEEYKTPVIASGLVCDKQTVIDSLKAGAIGICSTNYDVWNL